MTGTAVLPTGGNPAVASKHDTQDAGRAAHADICLYPVFRGCDRAAVPAPPKTLAPGAGNSGERFGQLVHIVHLRNIRGLVEQRGYAVPNSARPSHGHRSAGVQGQAKHDLERLTGGVPDPVVNRGIRRRRHLGPRPADTTAKLRGGPAQGTGDVVIGVHSVAPFHRCGSLRDRAYGVPPVWSVGAPRVDARCR